MTDPSLPVIDIAGVSDEALARQLDSAFTATGFCYFKDIGVTVVTADRRTPAYLNKFVPAEIERWAAPIKARAK